MNHPARLLHPSSVVHRILLATSAVLATLTLGACSAAPPAGADKFIAPPTGVSGVSSNTDVERYFPLVDGTIFSYRTETEDGDSGILVARVHRTDATHGELVYPTGKKRFVYAPDGILLEPSGSFVLKGPLQRGTTFRGQNGGRAEIVETGVVMDVKAGSYRDCIRVVEQRGGDRPARYATTFCPDVGVVAVEASAGMSFERAELVSAAPALNITDGTTVVPGPEAPLNGIPGPPPP